MRGVDVIGTAMTPFGRHLDRTHTDLAQAAVRGALDDAGIAPGRLDTTIYANVTQAFVAGEMSIPGEYVLRPLSITGVRTFRVEAACASATMAFHLAFDLIRSGLADVVLAVGAEKLYTQDREKRFAVFQQPLDIGVAADYLKRTEGRLAAIPPGLDTVSPNVLMEAYAAQARLHMATYGSTQEQFAAVAAKNHMHSVDNPLSQYRNPMTVAEVLAAPVVAWPLTNPMCAPISDGAAAAILCAADLTAALGATDRAIRILACRSRTGSDRDPADYAAHVTRQVSDLAYVDAGLGPADVDVAEVHDASSSGEVVQVEALGLCKPGEGGADALNGATALGGRIPVNVSGGLVSKGHPLGATGLAQIHDLVLQLRGTAGKRQVPDARIALAENSGGFYGVEDAMSCVTILASR
ncbi:thiolase family protein [Sphingomonas sp. SUN019]|uniref:thiolase family protein n=1 Tax=Sphingomonas sp. SUN019 TaxID=2937788 RepID=UPI0021645F80|nr:thiolase family protein [Sphingomonas sp. SUN019]UVO52005.1 thiolase family protein [Sphingomonas sp. SUN019]